MLIYSIRNRGTRLLDQKLSPTKKHSARIAKILDKKLSHTNNTSPKIANILDEKLRHTSLETKLRHAKKLSLHNDKVVHGKRGDSQGAVERAKRGDSQGAVESEGCHSKIACGHRINAVAVTSIRWPQDTSAMLMALIREKNMPANKGLDHGRQYS